MWLRKIVVEEADLSAAAAMRLVSSEDLLAVHAQERGVGPEAMVALEALADQIAEDGGEWPDGVSAEDLPPAQREYLVSLLRNRSVEDGWFTDGESALQALDGDDAELGQALRAGTDHDNGALAETTQGASVGESALVAAQALPGTAAGVTWGMATSIPFLGDHLQAAAGDDVRNATILLNQSMGLTRAEAELNVTLAQSSGKLLGWAVAGMAGASATAANIPNRYGQAAGLNNLFKAGTGYDTAGQELTLEQRLIAGFGGAGVGTGSQAAGAVGNAGRTALLAGGTTRRASQ